MSAFKVRFQNLFKIGLPSFWDTHGNLISQQGYLEFISQQINEDSKFKDIDKSLTRQVLIEKMGDGFNILSQFEMIVDSLPPFSYVQYNELEVLTKEMNSYDYPFENHWSSIIKMEKKAQVLPSRQNQICDFLYLF